MDRQQPNDTQMATEAEERNEEAGSVLICHRNKGPGSQTANVRT